MINASARRINFIASTLNKPIHYLEVGVETGQTFFAVDADSKTAVDPSFVFNMAEAPSDGSVTYHETTSDEFFCNLNRDMKYDLVFLDGLHTWDQTYRDFCNTLLFTHSKSVVIIDDIFPCDVFSCSRDQVEAVMMRGLMTGDTSNAWHGDTYKIIPLIQAFHPTLSYCTIISGGNPQTLVWRSSRPRLVSDQIALGLRIADLDVASLDYLWFLRNQHTFHLLEEEQALSLVSAELQIV